MNAPTRLQAALHQLLGDARLSATALAGTGLKLWLIDAASMDRAFDPEETRRILEEPPYWCFCWASGLVLARWLAAHPQWVRGQRVLDFGAGSGVAAIAAAKAGALEVVACDLDSLALAACRANAALKGKGERGKGKGERGKGKGEFSVMSALSSASFSSLLTPPPEACSLRPSA